MEGLAKLSVLVAAVAGLAIGSARVESPVATGHGVAPSKYVKDVKFALDELEKQCKALLEAKGIDWRKVRREFTKAAKKVRTDGEHWVLLTRLVARLQDGHASVVRTEAGKEIEWPERVDKTGPGIFLCVVGDEVVIKNAWGDGAAAGLEPGMTVVEIDGTKARKWLDARVEALRDLWPFSTEQQALFCACHQGLAEPPGTRLKLVVRAAGSRKQSNRTLTYGKANPTPWGPAAFPAGLEGPDSSLRWATLEDGTGYIHVRRCPGDLPTRFDTPLEKFAHAPGLILDFRGNSGGGFDHDALLGRFVPAGKELAFGKRIASAGPHPYAGPVVVIVDANVRSAGETASGMFRYDGRGYLIGESATAGMSASKTRIELPSGLFALDRIAVHSNKARYNDGKGLEGVGTIPHEIVQFDPEDLAAGKDTLIERARAVLADFPQKEVPYDPAKFGWETK